MVTETAVAEEVGEVTVGVIEAVVETVVGEVKIVVVVVLVLEEVQDAKTIENTMRQLSTIQNNPFFIFPPILLYIYWRLIKVFCNILNIYTLSGKVT